MVCGISSNMKRAYDAGNVLLLEGEGSLERRSHISVGQVSSVNKANLIG